MKSRSATREVFIRRSKKSRASAGKRADSATAVRKASMAKSDRIKARCRAAKSVRIVPTGRQQSPSPTAAAAWRVHSWLITARNSAVLSGK